MLAVITGASRGIGAAYAHQLGARGFALHLVGRDEQRLATVERSIRARHDIRIETAALDLAQPDSAERLYADVRSRWDATPDLLVNNAGFGLYGEFSSAPLPRVQEMLNLHILTVTKLMRLFLPAMRERKRGAIINVASVSGFLPLPYMAVYAATKAFMVSLGLSVGQEVRNDGVVVQTCCPGQTLTDFHRTSGRVAYALGGQQSADEVVAESLAALDRQSALVITGSRNRLLMMIQHFVPRRAVVWAAERSLRPSP